MAAVRPLIKRESGFIYGLSATVREARDLFVDRRYGSVFASVSKRDFLFFSSQKY